MCNSDSPEVWDCPICDGYNHVSNGFPDRETSEKWLNDYKAVLRAQKKLKSHLSFKIKK